MAPAVQIFPAEQMSPVIVPAAEVFIKKFGIPASGVAGSGEAT